MAYIKRKVFLTVGRLLENLHICLKLGYTNLLFQLQILINLNAERSISDEDIVPELNYAIVLYTSYFKN